MLRSRSDKCPRTTCAAQRVFLMTNKLTCNTPRKRYVIFAKVTDEEWLVGKCTTASNESFLPGEGEGKGDEFSLYDMYSTCSVVETMYIYALDLAHDDLWLYCRSSLRLL